MFHPIQALVLITIQDLKLCDSSLCVSPTLHFYLMLHNFGRFLSVTDLLILTGTSIVKISAEIMHAADISNIKGFHLLPQYI